MKKLIFSLALTALISPVFAKSKERQNVEAIFKAKCMDCHSDHTDYPWYFNMPIAKDIIKADIEKGKSYFHLQNDLFKYENDKDIPKQVITRLEHEISRDAMPPIQYKLAHWDRVITKTEETEILNWLDRLKGTIIEPLKAPTGLNSNKVDLGKILYHDTRLSGDLTLSCASCHDLAKGGTDQSQYATGINGQKGHINSPTVYNSSLAIKQFWDGRAEDLEAQAHGPVHNPVEMGSNWDQVLERIREDDDLVDRFKAVFKIKRSKEITGDMIANSIAEFEKSLVTIGSPFDKYLEGDKNAISDEAKQGYELFKKYNCTACHNGPAVGGASFQKMGIAHDYFKDRAAGANGLTKLAISKEDDGRFAVTQDKTDKYKFKVPTLRNVELTYPYFHDGSVDSLEDAVKYMAYYQEGKKLSNKETELIVTFLKTLTAPGLK